MQHPQEQQKAFVKNAADESQVKEAGSKVKRGRERDLNDVRSIMDTPHGRRFMNRLIAFCGVFKTSFTGNSTTFYNEGQRNVGLMVIADINESAPDLYLKMINEAKGNDNV